MRSTFLLLSIMLTLVMSGNTAFAQERDITGTVYDSSGPLPHATIQVKGTANEVRSDSLGNYSIKSHYSAILEFSMMDGKKIDIPINYSDKVYFTFSDDYFTLISCTQKKNRTFFGRIFHSIGNSFR